MWAGPPSGGRGPRLAVVPRLRRAAGLEVGGLPALRRVAQRPPPVRDLPQAAACGPPHARRPRLDDVGAPLPRFPDDRPFRRPALQRRLLAPVPRPPSVRPGARSVRAARARPPPDRLL